MLAGAAAANGAVPEKFARARTIMQYGTPRSATTAQWVIVSAYACALGLKADVRKTHNLTTVINMARGGAPLFVTHISDVPEDEAGTDLGALQKRERATKRKYGVADGFRPDAWRETALALERGWQLPEGAIAYVQETSLVALRDWRIVADYAGVFGLAQGSIAALEVVEYIRLWDVLRRCCGPQMSEDYRKRLYGLVANVSVTAFEPMHRGPGSLAYDACEMYDVGAVERLLMKTALARRCPKLNNKLGLLGSWARLDGTFCRRYEAAAVATRVGFNQNPFERLKQRDLDPSGP